MQSDHNVPFVAERFDAIGIVNLLNVVEDFFFPKDIGAKHHAAEVGRIYGWADVFSEQDVAFSAADPLGGGVDADIGAVGVAFGADHVQDIGVDKASFALVEKVFPAMDVDSDRAFGYEAKLNGLVPMPVDIAEDVFTELSFINGNGELFGSQCCEFFSVTVDGNIVYLHCCETSIL